MCSAGELRAIVNEGRRSLCVKDDPIADDPHLPDNPAHAVAIRSHNQDEPEVLRIRGELMDRFSDLISIAEVFEPST